MPFEIPQKTEQEQRVQMGRIALEAIAAHILTVPPEKFDMGAWCGTACCAIGNTINLPEVRATGLYLAKGTCDAFQKAYPAFNGRVEDFGSIAEAFEIEKQVAMNLFGSSDDEGTREAVANRIRGYLGTR